MNGGGVPGGDVRPVFRIRSRILGIAVACPCYVWAGRVIGIGAERHGVWGSSVTRTGRGMSGGTGGFCGEAGSGAPPVAHGKRAGDTTAPPAVVPKGGSSATRGNSKPQEPQSYG